MTPADRIGDERDAARAEVAALRAVANAARPFRAKQLYEYWRALDLALIALDAPPPADEPDPAPPQGADVELMWVGGQCAWNEETGRHERGVGRDRDECRYYCGARLMPVPAGPQPAGETEGVACVHCDAPIHQPSEIRCPGCGNPWDGD